MEENAKMTKQQLAALICAMAKDEILEAECRAEGNGIVIRLGNGQMFYITVKEL